jgi:hypothetical protein
VHQIAVQLFLDEETLHDPNSTKGLNVEEVTLWEGPRGEFFSPRPSSTLFSHPRFHNWTAYPNGIADVVGYWAEDRILGGVALFDRSLIWDSNNEPNMYLAPGRDKVTFRFCQLLDSQQTALVNFLMSDSANHTHHPLPIIPADANRVRVNPDDAIEFHKIYRDIWERSWPVSDRSRRNDRWVLTKNKLDFPEIDTEGYFAEIRRRRDDAKARIARGEL